ncbi:head maturation protease, ClpP-related [Streptomyces sp. NPDC059441]|uniref:head maturation protease, ClpP-related n=1 Tax=Streptomyces sp. NPDC059441 TaxID=3346829 RepID=UPI0036C3CE7B
MPFIDLPDRIPGLRAQARSDQPWYRITNQAADEAEVMLYDEVGGWYGATADEFINDLRGITAPNILLRINSPGGSVTEGIAIANALRSHPANVTVQVDGIAASIASVIAMAGDTVRMMPNALLMVHEASGLCAGDATDMIKMAEILNKISDNIAGAYAERAGGTEAEWRQVMKDETWYRGDEAVKAGLADEVVQTSKRGEPVTEPGEPEPEMRKAFDLTAYGYNGPKQAEAPKPAAVDPEPLPTLIINVESALADEEIVKRLRAMAGRPPEQASETPPENAEQAPLDDTGAADNAVEPEPAAVVEPDPVDEWAAAVAHLVQPKPDPWAALVAQLTHSTSAASSATQAA